MKDSNRVPLAVLLVGLGIFVAVLLYQLYYSSVDRATREGAEQLNFNLV